MTQRLERPLKACGAAWDTKSNETGSCSVNRAAVHLFTENGSAAGGQFFMYKGLAGGNSARVVATDGSMALSIVCDATGVKVGEIGADYIEGKSFKRDDKSLNFMWNAIEENMSEARGMKTSATVSIDVKKYLSTFSNKGNSTGYVKLDGVYFDNLRLRRLVRAMKYLGYSTVELMMKKTGTPALGADTNRLIWEDDGDYAIIMNCIASVVRKKGKSALIDENLYKDICIVKEV